MLKKDIILIDEALENDHRVLSSIKHYNDPVIIDCSKYKYTIPNFYILLLQNAWTLSLTVLYSPIFWIKFYKRYHFFPRGIYTGLKTSLKNKYIADKTTLALIEEYANYKIHTIHANDLTCGLIAGGLSKNFRCQLTYDAHELEFHRNRKNSFLRVVYDVLLEKKVITASNKVIVVNKPIFNVYNHIYSKQLTSIDIMNNKHFTPYYNYALDAFDNTEKDISILYIGAATQNRMLENLNQESLFHKIKVYGFFLKDKPINIIGNHWILGGKTYLSSLLNMIDSQRLIMWCCADNICLSYKLSLPNKFFQAMAVGIPIIAYKETYLAKIVEEYNIGYIYDDENFKEIIDALKDTNNYYTLVKSISLFQKKLFIDKIVL